MTLLLEMPEAASSLVHRLDARWKLAALVPAAFAVLVLCTPLPALTALVGTLLLVAVSRLPWRWYLVRLGAALAVPALFALWLAFVPRPGDALTDAGGLGVSVAALARALALLAKAACVISLMLVLLATAPLHDTLKAAQSLRAPGWLVHIALLAYRYVFLLAEEFGRLRTALRVRGYRNHASLHSYRTIGQVAGTLLVRGHERSERVAQAMRCRGFDGQFRSLHGFQTHGGDVFFFALVLTFAAALVAWDYGLKW